MSNAGAGRRPESIKAPMYAPASEMRNTTAIKIATMFSPFAAARLSATPVAGLVLRALVSACVRQSVIVAMVGPDLGPAPVACINRGYFQ
jgi:hypothetical protein